MLTAGLACIQVLQLPPGLTMLSLRRMSHAAAVTVAQCCSSLRRLELAFCRVTWIYLEATVRYLSTSLQELHLEAIELRHAPLLEPDLALLTSQCVSHPPMN